MSGAREITVSTGRIAWREETDGGCGLSAFNGSVAFSHSLCVTGAIPLRRLSGKGGVARLGAGDHHRAQIGRHPRQHPDQPEHPRDIGPSRQRPANEGERTCQSFIAQHSTGYQQVKGCGCLPGRRTGTARFIHVPSRRTCRNKPWSRINGAGRPGWSGSHKLVIENITARSADTHSFPDRCLLIPGEHADRLYRYHVEHAVSERQRLHIALF